MGGRLVKIILVDDHVIFRNGLKSLIEQEEIGIIAGEASNGVEFLNLLDNLIPDLVLMDIDMPVMNGFEACEKALNKNSNLNILVLSMFEDYSYYTDLLNLGVKGFISKTSGKMELERGIEAVSNGDNYFSANLFKNIAIDLKKSKDIKNNDGFSVQFTGRELEILKLICKGMDTSEIASVLFLSNKTIDNHRSKMIQKIGVKNSVGLVIHAIKNKIIRF